MPGPKRKISVEDAIVIREEYESGSSLHSLARRYSVSPASISRTVTRAGGVVRPTGRPLGTKAFYRRIDRGLLAWLNS